MSTEEAKIAIVQVFMNALETNNLEKAAGYLAEHFMFDGWTPRPLDKQSFLIVMRGLKTGIPDMLFRLDNVREEDNRVTATIQVTGHQTDSFELVPLSLPPIPQMAGNISLPSENVSYLFEDNLIIHMSIQHVVDGGIQGLLHQIGVDVTPIQ